MAERSAPSILLLGSTGQIGWELARTLAPLGTLVAPVRAELDLTQRSDVRAVIRALRPTVIVNAAAYTAVDAAEADPAGTALLNTELPSLLASEAATLGALLLHYSTDYVFDGRGTRPYREDDATAPLGVYGRTKLAGDEAILASDAEAYILRVAWVYGTRGKNFLRTMLRLAAEREELRVVADQWGTPTWARAIAEVSANVVTRLVESRRDGTVAPPPGVYHVASPDATTWHGFASAIVARSEHSTVRVVPIGTEAYPTPAARPAYSVLDAGRLAQAFDQSLASWERQLDDCLQSR
jgi:dTDP-4-dehydrorhamnose reductase